MRKFILKFFLGALVLINFCVAADYKVQQGSTLSLVFPVDQVKNIEGHFEDQDLTFSVVSKTAHIDEFITRGEFMYLIKPFLLSAGSRESESPYPDVSKNYRYAEAISLATDKAIVGGYADGRFGAEDTLTRAQAAKIIMNVFPSLDLSAESANFPDVEEGHSLKRYIDLAVKNKIFKGYPDGNFRPSKPLSIREAYIILDRGNGGEFNHSEIKKFYWRSLIGISRLKPARLASLELSFNGVKKNLAVEVVPRNFAQKSFSLPVSQDEIRTTAVQNNSWDMINGARKFSESNQLWSGTFITPTIGEKTLGYGDQLTINGASVGSHFGHDYANDEGTDIWAANHGKVVLADSTPSFGKTVIIDHGQNVFTMYLHNSVLKVKEGDLVRKGDTIALMGSTGISTGPHLHYSHWVGESIVDGEEWFEREY